MTQALRKRSGHQASVQEAAEEVGDLTVAHSGTSIAVPVASPADERGFAAPTWRLRHLAWMLSLPFLAFLVLPLAALVLRLPPERLISSFSSRQVVQAVALSMATTTVTAVVTICLGTPVGYLLARRRFRLRQVVDTLVDLPTVLPPAVAGVALLMAFGRRGVLGSTLDAWGIHIAFSWVAVVMAQTFVASAFYVKAAALGFAGINPELEQSAALDGAGSWQVFRHVTLPLAWSALLSGAVMTWARALGEFGATMIFAGNYPGRTQTMPLAIYLGFELDLNVALTLAVILVGCSFLVLMVVKGILHREVNEGVGG
jgi:molybdate transport system permease protein